MLGKTENENLYRDILDAILFRDPKNAIQQSEVIEGTTRMHEVVTFADGSRLRISAMVPLPPLADMTPERVYYFCANGDKGEKTDDGSNEASTLAFQSTAIRLMKAISGILDTIPEQEKETCPECEGNTLCSFCQGSGCDHCGSSGRCGECGGRGLVIKE